MLRISELPFVFLTPHRILPKCFHSCQTQSLLLLVRANSLNQNAAHPLPYRCDHEVNEPWQEQEGGPSLPSPTLALAQGSSACSPAKCPPSLPWMQGGIKCPDTWELLFQTLWQTLCRACKAPRHPWSPIPPSWLPSNHVSESK